jgi:hypothetical protein
MALTKASYSMITGAPVNVKDFGATGDGTTDDTAAIQAAITYIYSFANAGGTGRPPALYFPTGTYLMSSTITMGNTGFDYTLSPYFFGDGTGSVIKVDAANVNPFYWRGPTLGTPGAGNQCAGPTIENMWFVGPGQDTGGTNTNSIALNFNTVQGVRLINTLCINWNTGENYKDTDVIYRLNASCEYNYTGINSGTLNGLIRLDRMLNNGGTITHNTNYGIYYIGGQTPSWNDVFFNSNGTSLALSVSPPTATCITVGAVIQGCYFEADTGSSINLGGGSGVVRDLCIQGGAIAGNSSSPLIYVTNYVNSTGLGFVNMNLNNNGVGGIIGYFQAVPGVNFSQSLLIYPNINSGSGSKSVLAAASSSILSAVGFGTFASLSLTVRSISQPIALGTQTAKKFQVAMIGGGDVTGLSSTVTTDYGAGASFTLTQTTASGTNTLTLNNTSANPVIFYYSWILETGQVTLL